MEHKPTKNQIKEAVERSGYLLEMRLHRYLESHKFFTDSDKQFQDQDTGKSREIDLYAWKYIDLVEHVVSSTDESTTFAHDYLRPELIIECKSNSTPVVFLQEKLNIHLLAALSSADFLP